MRWQHSVSLFLLNETNWHVMNSLLTTWPDILLAPACYLTGTMTITEKGIERLFSLIYNRLMLQERAQQPHSDENRTIRETCMTKTKGRLLLTEMRWLSFEVNESTVVAKKQRDTGMES